MWITHKRIHRLETNTIMNAKQRTLPEIMSNRMEVTLSRRGFLRAGLAGAAGLVVARDVSGREGKTPGAEAREPVVYTVTGTIPAADMGFTLHNEILFV